MTTMRASLLLTTTWPTGTQPGSSCKSPGSSHKSCPCLAWRMQTYLKCHLTCPNCLLLPITRAYCPIKLWLAFRYRDSILRLQSKNSKSTNPKSTTSWMFLQEATLRLTLFLPFRWNSSGALWTCSSFWCLCSCGRLTCLQTHRQS